MNQNTKIIALTVLLSLNLFIAISQTEYLTKVNAATGAYIKIDSLPGVMWIALSNYSTFDENNHRYFFNGSPDLLNWYLFSVDALTGKIISKPSFPNNNNITQLQYGQSTNTCMVYR
jgi:hypothetical protein